MGESAGGEGRARSLPSAFQLVPTSHTPLSKLSGPAIRKSLPHCSIGSKD